MKEKIQSLGRLLTNSEKTAISGGHLMSRPHPCCVKRKPRVHLCECPKEKDIFDIEEDEE